MADRVFNFGAGPATLPRAVLEEAQRDLVELPDLRMSPLEVSHRSMWFEDVIREAELNLRGLLAIPDGYRVLFVQGGASLQFSMVAMNLLRDSGAPADYVITGSWGERALAEATKEGEVRVPWNGKEEGYRRVPWKVHADPEAAYLHITSNETIQGIQWPPGAEPPHPRLVADASSEFLSRPVDVGRYAVLYAGAQKNAGPAGITVVIVRDDVVERAPTGLPSMLDYRTYAKTGSMHNTPPVFSIYIVQLVTRWLRDEVGGIEAQDAWNKEKAALLYDAIDTSGGFYLGHADVGSRSLMNVTFRLHDPDLEEWFVIDAADHGLVELAGHRSVGGIRASIYNAMPREGVEALVEFMRDFVAKAG